MADARASLVKDALDKSGQTCYHRDAQIHGCGGVFASRSRRIESKIAPPITGPQRPAVCLSSDGNLMGGVFVSSGIYEIRNQTNGKRYVGSAVNIRRRWQQHLRHLRHGRHSNRHLQRAFEKYGEPAFAFSVLEHIEDTAQLILHEQHFLDTLSPEYNISPTAGSPLGIQRTEETRARVSAVHKGIKLSEAHCRAIGEASKGRSPSPETRTKLSEALRGERGFWYGKHLSKETRKKLSAAHKGQRSSFLGKHHSEATKRKLSEAFSGERHPNFGKHLSEETRGKISEAQKGERGNMYGKHHSEETKRKMSEAQKAYWRRARATKEKGET